MRNLTSTSSPPILCLYQLFAHIVFTKLGTECQGDVLVGSAVLDLAPPGIRPVLPHNLRARLLGAPNDQPMPAKRVAKDAAEIVPDLTRIQAVGVVELGSARVQAVRLDGDFKGDAARDGVAAEGLRVLPARGVERVGFADGGADGPDGGFKVAVVDNAGLADG